MTRARAKKGGNQAKKVRGAERTPRRQCDFYARARLLAHPKGRKVGKWKGKKEKSLQKIKGKEKGDAVMRVGKIGGRSAPNGEMIPQ